MKENNPPKTPLVFAGFDGFIDTIAKPVLKSGSPGKPPVYFKTIGEFGRYIAEHAGKSASMELDILDRRMGGNMPNFVRGIAALGAEVYGVGMLGGEQGKTAPVFFDLPDKTFSFAPAGTATALEFEDGKIFFAPRYTLPADPWSLIEKSLENAPDSKSISEILQAADLIACLNWSELSFMDELWRKLFEKCAACLSPDREKFVLFDLSDFSRRDDADVRRVLTLGAQFSALRTTILSLNRNEALLLGEPESGDLAGIAEKLAGSYAIDEIVIHCHDRALVRTAGETFTAEISAIQNPKISTGAGDHFNAAYAFAAMMKLSPLERLRFGGRCAGIYVSGGKSPVFGDLAPMLV